jgi:predicted acetyltransferase
MDVELRRATPADVEPLLALDGRSFGYDYTAEDIEDFRTIFELDRLVVGYDGPELVAESGAWTFDVTVPGGALVPAAGVTFVAVSASHRRRGLLRLMMADLLDDAAERAEPVALLSASESSIYERFGFGLGTYRAALAVEPHRVGFRTGLGDDGLVRYADAVTARKVVPEIYDRMRRERPGTVSRHDRWWDFTFRDAPGTRQGATTMQYAVHPDGYVSYRIANEQNGGFPANRVKIRELVAVTAVAYASLWRFLLGIDLVSDVEWTRASLDEPLPWLVDEPRRIRTEAVDDDTWVRLVDVEAALAARRYSTADRFVVEITDSFRPATAGRYEIDGSPDGAACRRTLARPDVAMDVADLGSLYLGGVAASSLGRAGRIEERTPGALRRATAFFLTDPPPHNQTSY